MQFIMLSTSSSGASKISHHIIWLRAFDQEILLFRLLIFMPGYTCTLKSADMIPYMLHILTSGLSASQTSDKHVSDVVSVAHLQLADGLSARPMGYLRVRWAISRRRLRWPRLAAARGSVDHRRAESRVTCHVSRVGRCQWRISSESRPSHADSGGERPCKVDRQSRLHSEMSLSRRAR